jgi:hypothetical protein
MNGRHLALNRPPSPLKVHTARMPISPPLPISPRMTLAVNIYSPTTPSAVVFYEIFLALPHSSPCLCSHTRVKLVYSRSTEFIYGIHSLSSQVMAEGHSFFFFLSRYDIHFPNNKANFGKSEVRYPSYCIRDLMM